MSCPAAAAKHGVWTPPRRRPAVGEDPPILGVGRGLETTRPRDPRTSLRRRLLLPVAATLVVATLVVATLVVATLLAAACHSPARVETLFSGATMGTTYSVKVVTAEPMTEEEEEELAAGIRAVLDRVDHRMSTYREDSELSRLNRAPAGEPTPLSAETFDVLSLAVAVSGATGGAFDPTVAPLVDAWGFGPDPHEKPPSPALIAELRARTGVHHLELDAGSSSVRKRLDAVACDLSAVAKGYAVDAVSEALLAAGLEDSLVEVGGEIRVHGENRRQQAWRVAIERPVAAGRDLHRIVPLRAGAVATSGDYRNFYEHGGRRVSHTIDPRSGEPIRHPLASVSVFHHTAAVADAWATGLLVLGPGAGLALATERNLPALFLVYDQRGGVDEHPTPAFEALLESGELPDPGPTESASWHSS